MSPLSLSPACIQQKHTLPVLLVLKKKYNFHCKIQKYSADIPLIKNGLSDERNQVAARRAVIYEVSRKGHVLVRINQLSVSNLPRSAAFLHPDGFNWVLSLMLCCLCRNGFRGLDSQPIKTCFWQTGYTNMCKFQKKNIQIQKHKIDLQFNYSYCNIVEQTKLDFLYIETEAANL